MNGWITLDAYFEIQFGLFYKCLNLVQLSLVHSPRPKPNRTLLVQVRNGTGNKSRQGSWCCRKGGLLILLPRLPSRSLEANVKIKSFHITPAGRAPSPERGY